MPLTILQRLAILILFTFFAGTIVAKDVLITSTPVGAEVVVDGKVIGKTPLKTTKKNIMPFWAYDGAITNATIEIRMPLYTSYSITVSEFSVPKEISAVLEQNKDALLFENYLESVDGLAERTNPSKKPASLYLSENLDADSIKLEQDGYLLVGYIGASASVVPFEMIKQKSELLAGSIILIKSSDAGTQTELRAVKSTISGGAISTFGNSSTNGSASAYASGSNGFGGDRWNASGSAYGSSSTSSSAVTYIPSRTATTWIPYSTRQYSTQATVWRKLRGNEVGLALDSLPAPLRTELQRNSGAYVASVDEGSSAFLSDVLVGDVVIELAGQQIRQPSDFDLIIERTGLGTALPIVVLRNGKRVAFKLSSK